jgi:transcriptional regulator with XRE-family HTH domain
MKAKTVNYYKRRFMKRLLVARELAGHSQVELARMSGYSQATIAQLETGRKLPSFETLIKLAQVFRVEPDFFL